MSEELILDPKLDYTDSEVEKRIIKNSSGEFTIINFHISGNYSFYGIRPKSASIGLFHSINTEITSSTPFIVKRIIQPRRARRPRPTDNNLKNAMFSLSMPAIAKALKNEE